MEAKRGLHHGEGDRPADGRDGSRFYGVSFPKGEMIHGSFSGDRFEEILEICGIFKMALGMHAAMNKKRCLGGFRDKLTTRRGGHVVGRSSWVFGCVSQRRQGSALQATRGPFKSRELWNLFQEGPTRLRGNNWPISYAVLACLCAVLPCLVLHGKHGYATSATTLG